MRFAPEDPAFVASSDRRSRDPEAFEAPDDLRLDRDPNPHLTFGAGIYFCLGAASGRLELQTSFRALLDRFPRIEAVVERRGRPAT